MEIHFLGTRGSMPTVGDNFLKYGQDTSAYLIISDNDAIFLDAGTGICHPPDIEGKKISIILSHLHLDHIMGLPFFPYLSKDVPIDIYSALPEMELEFTLDRIFSPPFWPCTLSDYQAELSYKRFSDSMKIGDFKLSTAPGHHPDGCHIIRLDVNGHSLCYATDYERSETNSALIRLARDCDYLLFDGQYTKEEYEKYIGFGHSTKEDGVAISKAADVSHLIFTHHDPRHTDEFLEKELACIKADYEAADLAKQGEIIKL